MVKKKETNELSATTLSDSNKKRAGEAGAIEAVVNAINNHPNNIKLCKNGCYALYNLLSKGNKHKNYQCIAQTKSHHIGYNNVRAGETGVIRALLKAIDKHTKDVNLCKNGGNAIYFVIENGTKNYNPGK